MLWYTNKQQVMFVIVKYVRKISCKHIYLNFCHGIRDSYTYVEN
jgi:hypothetical protein